MVISSLFPLTFFFLPANHAFIASQMGHENAKIVNRVDSKWIAGMNFDHDAVLNSRLSNLLLPKTNGNGKCH
ncbi:MAG: hypothetical protein EOM46_20445 [Gammaproteobacteria bacterium]|nr:hypothetical protein [Gammaproteobacteria bacterium]